MVLGPGNARRAVYLPPTLECEQIGLKDMYDQKKDKYTLFSEIRSVSDVFRSKSLRTERLKNGDFGADLSRQGPDLPGALFKVPGIIDMDHTLQYSAYQRALSNYSDASPMVLTPLAHPTPHQPTGQYLGGAIGPPLGVNEENMIYALVIELMDPESREAALLELSKKREQYDDLALVLWHAFGPSLLHYSSIMTL